jgi:hypothetical protein
MPNTRAQKDKQAKNESKTMTKDLGNTKERVGNRKERKKISASTPPAKECGEGDENAKEPLSHANQGSLKIEHGAECTPSRLCSVVPITRSGPSSAPDESGSREEKKRITNSQTC